jgi:hypothetical protein
MSSSDSDEEIGKRIDQSSDEEYKKPKKKKSQKSRKAQEEYQPKEKKHKEKPPEKLVEVIQPRAPPPPLPPSGRLNKARRDYIIENFNLGKEDPEYNVLKLPNGNYRVSKRKSYFNPTAKVESGNGDIPMTWMNLQTQVNESLTHDMKKLRKKYEKLADKYESRPTEEPPKPAPLPVVQPPVAAPPPPQRTPTRRGNPMTYVKRRGYDVREY